MNTSDKPLYTEVLNTPDGVYVARYQVGQSWVYELDTQSYEHQSKVFTFRTRFGFGKDGEVMFPVRDLMENMGLTYQPKLAINGLRTYPYKIQAQGRPLSCVECVGAVKVAKRHFNGTSFSQCDALAAWIRFIEPYIMQARESELPRVYNLAVTTRDKVAPEPVSNTLADAFEATAAAAKKAALPTMLEKIQEVGPITEEEQPGAQAAAPAPAAPAVEEAPAAKPEEAEGLAAGLEDIFRAFVANKHEIAAARKELAAFTENVHDLEERIAALQVELADAKALAELQEEDLNNLQERGSQLLQKMQDTEV